MYSPLKEYHLNEYASIINRKQKQQSVCMGLITAIFHQGQFGKLLDVRIIKKTRNNHTNSENYLFE
jgi:hypothetical protein